MTECRIGLDTNVFAMRIEDCFGISIRDEDAAEIKTVGELFDYIRQRVPGGSSTACLTSKAFYYLRRMLVQEFRCDRSQVAPRTLLRTLFQNGRRRQFAKLGRSLRVHLPWWNPNISRLGLAILLISCLPVFFVCGALGAKLLGISAVFAMLPIMVLLYLNKMYSRYQTVGDLTTVVLERHFKEFTAEGASDQQVWESIVSILCSEAGMNRPDITRDLRFGDIPSDL